ncbi:MAG TPA: hypothetical protein VGL24_07630 [Chthoniobacterales bacterium]|jgi:hypothetical protein
MNGHSNRWDQLLGEAELLLPKFLEATDGLAHEKKGIRRSELFFFYALVAPRPPSRIVESGRARAQSTHTLSRLFPNAAIVSLESDPHSPDVAIAAEKLKDCANVECRFGDSLALLPEIVEPGDVVLIDGPKDFRALKLAFRLLAAGRTPAVFVHDLWIGSPARNFVDRRVPSALLSDNTRWVKHYATLDSDAPPPTTTDDARVAYGATLGCFHAGEENYRQRLAQCRAAQGADRLRETARKLLRQPPVRRPKDFAMVEDKRSR